MAYDSFQRNTIVHTVYSDQDLSSDDSLIEGLSERYSDHIMINPSIENKLYSISRILEVTVTFYQCVPFISIIKEDYSALYSQLDTAFTNLMSFVTVFLSFYP